MSRRSIYIKLLNIELCFCRVTDLSQHVTSLFFIIAPVKPIVVAETQQTTPAAKPVLTLQMKQPASPESPASDSEPEKGLTAT